MWAVSSLRRTMAPGHRRVNTGDLPSMPYKARMARGSCLVLSFLLALSVGAPLRAQEAGEEGDFDRLDRADETVALAVAAADAGNWEEARRLAEEVMFLDDSYATAPARVVLVRALENEEAYDSALYELKQYLELPLTDEERASAERLGARLEARKAGTYRRPRRPLDRNGRIGLGLVLGGAVPAILGGSLLANDLHWASIGVQSGTWAAIGTPIMIVGLAIDIVGIVVLSRSRAVQATVAGRPRLDRPRPAFHFSVAPSPEGMAVSAGLSW